MGARTFEGIKQSESVVLVNKLDNDWVAINFKGKKYYCLLSSLMTSTPSCTIQTGPRGGQY